jgi:hypothetical protein
MIRDLFSISKELVMNRFKVTFSKSLLLVACTVAALRGGTIDYRFALPSDLQTTSFDFGGVTVTGGPGLVFVAQSDGLSIIGGNDSAVDPGEFLTFTFDQGPTNLISVDFNSVLTSTATLQAFGPASLGSQAVTVDTALSPLDVSGAFGDQAITSFTLTGLTGGFRLDMITFETPEPSSLALLLAGLGAIVVLGLRARRQSHL